jgi:hypothetical protein
LGIFTGVSSDTLYLEVNKIWLEVSNNEKLTSRFAIDLFDQISQRESKLDKSIVCINREARHP